MLYKWTHHLSQDVSSKMEEELVCEQKSLKNVLCHVFCSHQPIRYWRTPGHSIENDQSDSDVAENWENNLRKQKDQLQREMWCKGLQYIQNNWWVGIQGLSSRNKTEWTDTQVSVQILLSKRLLSVEVCLHTFSYWH